MTSETTMTDETIVAVFETASAASSAVAALIAAGLPSSAISTHAGDAGAAATTTASRPVRESGFWSTLLGGESTHDATVYDRSVASGSTVVSVKTTASRADEVLEILESHNPLDIDERAAGYGLTETTKTSRAVGSSAASLAPTAKTQVGGDESLQLSEESLDIGKRLINRGGTRVRRYVVETPVEQAVTLRDEKVTLERRPVADGRAVGADEFGDKTIEMTETAEEAVVSKTARVYEEVGLRKEATDRVQTVRDTVRKEEVAVEQIAGSAKTGPAAMPNPAKPKL